MTDILENLNERDLKQCSIVLQLEQWWYDHMYNKLILGHCCLKLSFYFSLQQQKLLENSTVNS